MSSLLTPTSQVASNYGNTGTTQYGQSTNATQANQYTPGQQALQAQLNSAYGNLLSGNIPSSYTSNPNLVGAYTSAFNQSEAPSLALQGGAGSPQLQSNYALGLQNLLSNQYNTGVSEYQNSLAGATSPAYSAVGSQSGSGVTGAQASTGAGISNSILTQPYTLLQLLSQL
jgi:hypothetical protein